MKLEGTITYIQTTEGDPILQPGEGTEVTPIDERSVYIRIVGNNLNSEIRIPNISKVDSDFLQRNFGKPLTVNLKEKIDA
jgi:hypothetical protein